eukprot:TRINITY_DN2994_c0_g1_i2.p1 TRINITY_DN2994_c0_g1~~TRINITY_DN2994_c0_g1_i2.p1  ORF type:complete len:248 (+),score=70.20 TRINITY_DN2994_c0_g1_i2:371-1114(+)
MSPKLYWTYHKGRVEEFIPSKNVHGREHEPEIATKIAQKVAQFHKAQVPGDRSAVLFKRLTAWLEVSRTREWETPEIAAAVAALDLDAVAKDVALFREIVEQKQPSPVVFAHNDLIGANVLQQADGSLLLIDFEYSEYNYRGFDLGNHFNEYCGFDCDYSLFPKKDAQAHFFRAYLRETNGRDATDSEVEAMYREVNPFSMLSNMFWGVWAVVMASISDIEFDYPAYAKKRLDEYRRRRDELLKLWD